MANLFLNFGMTPLNEGSLRPLDVSRGHGSERFVSPTSGRRTSYTLRGYGGVIPSCLGIAKPSRQGASIFHLDISPVGRASGVFAASAGADLRGPGIIACRNLAASSEPDLPVPNT